MTTLNCCCACCCDLDGCPWWAALAGQDPGRDLFTTFAIKFRERRFNHVGVRTGLVDLFFRLPWRSCPVPELGSVHALISATFAVPSFPVFERIAFCVELFDSEAPEVEVANLQTSDHQLAWVHLSLCQGDPSFFSWCWRVPGDIQHQAARS